MGEYRKVMMLNPGSTIKRVQPIVEKCDIARGDEKSPALQ
jgi:hypothetical protein